MTRKLIALVAAAAIAATGFSAAPAQARNNGETAAIIAGVAALAIVGATLASDRNKHRRHDGHVSRGHNNGRGYYAPPRHRGYGYGNGHRGYRDQGYRSHRGYGYGRHDGYLPYGGHRGYGYGYGGGRYRHDGR